LPCGLQILLHLLAKTERSDALMERGEALHADSTQPEQGSNFVKLLVQEEYFYERG
jgi:hypothetical protein